MAITQLESVEHIADLVQSGATVQAVGARTKPLLARGDEGCQLLDCRRLNGITEYEPTEFTFTAKPGTPVSEIKETLKEYGQYLPFDPPFAESGSTIGGAVASGLNGSSSMRFGGIRDFVLGIKYIDGTGCEISSGGKVVKNAAGFDMSKFMVGSYGRFGVLTEITLKVFPQPEMFATVGYSVELAQALGWIKKLILTPLEIDAIDWLDGQLWIRLGGPSQTVETASIRIEKLFDRTPNQRLTGSDETALWSQSNEFQWHDSHQNFLIKIPCLLTSVSDLESIATGHKASLRLALGGQLAYCSVPQDKVNNLVTDLRTAAFKFLLVSGPSESAGFSEKNTPELGTFGMSIKRAVDPNNQFAIL